MRRVLFIAYLFPPVANSGTRRSLAFANHLPAFAAAIGITLARAAAGFGMALMVMLPLGVVVGRLPRFGQFVEPLFELLRPLPPLAIVPVAMLFAGTGSAATVTFGWTLPSVISMELCAAMRRGSPWWMCNTVGYFTPPKSL